MGKIPQNANLKFKKLQAVDQAQKKNTDTWPQ